MGIDIINTICRFVLMARMLAEDYDIILVTFNYRLGPLGFLNLELQEAPGNVGLMDQVEALRWTKENIAKFGGDPDNITIGGVSAGSASVHYHLLSHSARGLFQKAIMHSGSAFHPWAFQKHHIKRAFQLCEALGHSTNNTKDALDFLLKLPADKLLAKMPPEVEGELIQDFIFVPSIEKVFPNQKPFLEESPFTRMVSGNYHKVPQIVGFNSGEGIFFNFFLQENPDILNQFEADFQKFIPTDLDLSHGSEDSKSLAEKIRKFYFDDKPVAENVQKLVDAISDNWVTRGVNEQVKLTVEKQTEPVYFYEYSFSESHPAKEMFGDHNLTGVCHGEELVNLFKLKVMSLDEDKPNVLLTQKRMLEMWTNFIKTGNPTPEITDVLSVKWEPATRDKLNYLNIDSNLTLGTNPEKNRVKFWEDATKQHSQVRVELVH
ncbi:venom carboxylesterase-6-like [Ctenocephalides felis]|nr:venom carboxylesterase-6-like [Ctenocephalides felis]